MSGYLGLINIDTAASGGGITASSTDTLTNKTIDFDSNTITNLPGGITASSSDTLTNKSIDFDTNTITNLPGITASSSDTLTNKSIDFDTNTITNLPGGAEFTATGLKTASYTAVSGDWVLTDANGAGGDIDITLPSSPSAGDAVKITLTTAHATRKITINRNSSTIDGGTAAEFQTFNILWKSGDTVTFRCVASSAWVTAERQISNRFICQAYLNSEQNNLVANSYTLVNNDAVSYDYNGDFDTGSAHDYTAPITGTYMLIQSTAFTSGSIIADKKYSTQLRVAGAGGATSSQHAATGGELLHVMCTSVIVANAGDSITQYANADAGENTVDLNTGDTNTFFQIYFISR
jgi:hypothetical protein